MSKTKKLLEENGHNVSVFSARKNSERGILTSIYNPKYYFELKKYLHDKSFDIIHLHRFEFILTPAILPAIRKETDAKIIFHVHDFLLVCPELGTTYDDKVCPDYNKRFGFHFNCRKFAKESFFHTFFKSLRLRIHRYLIKKYVDCYIVPSKELARMLRESLNIQNDKINYIPNFIEMEEDKGKFQSINPRQFLFVGRLSKEKGIEIAIRAIRKMVEDGYEDVKLKIVGIGLQLEELKKLVSELNIKRNVVFKGWVNKDELEKCYRGAIAVIMPSIWLENNPLVGLEAMKNKKPIIASEVGGYSDLVEEGKNGWLFELGNTEKLAQYMEKIYNNISLSKKMGEYSHKKVKKDFGVNVYWKNLNKVYKSSNKRCS